MKHIFIKLESEYIENVYLINNVSVGLDSALKLKAVKKEKELYNKLLEMRKYVGGLRMPIFRPIDWNDQRSAQDIGYEAANLLREYLY